MPTFDYQGRDMQGRAITGKRLAHSAGNLSTELFREGITPIHISADSGMPSLWSKIRNLLQGNRVSIDELSIFARQMNTLCKTGVPITTAIKQLAQNSRSLHLTQVLNGVVENLESGMDLAAAMQIYPEVFTTLMVSMIRVGQSSGKLDEAFLYLNEYLELEGGTIKRIKTALRYPSFVFFAILFAIIMVNLFVIPTFATIFATANLKLPMLTTFLINMSLFFRSYAIVLLILLSMMISGIIYYLKTVKGAILWSQYQLKIPLLGKILKRIVLMRFSQIFSVTIKAGVPLLEGLNLVAQAVTNRYARVEIENMRLAIQRGNNLTQAAAASELFTPLELQMLSVSEETGELGPMLEHIGQFYQREVDYDLKRLNDIIEPVLIIALAIMIAVLAFAVYLPIWNMIKLVHY